MIKPFWDVDSALDKDMYLSYVGVGGADNLMSDRTSWTQFSRAIAGMKIVLLVIVDHATAFVHDPDEDSQEQGMLGGGQFEESQSLISESFFAEFNSDDGNSQPGFCRGKTPESPSPVRPNYSRLQR